MCRRAVSQKPGDASRRQAGAERGQPLPDPLERFAVGHLTKPEIQLSALARFGEQALLGALQRETLAVEQGLDALHQLEVPGPVQALAGGVLLGPEQLELRLPVPQHVRRHLGDLFDLADPVVQLLGGVDHHRAHDAAPALIRCFSPLLGLKVSTLRAVISILSPVWGFRPRREALRRIRKCPNPTIFTSSLFSKQRKMMSKTDSTTDADCRFDSPCAATALTRSFLVIGEASPPRGRRADYWSPRAMNGL